MTVSPTLRRAAQRLPALGALTALVLLVACSEKKPPPPPAGPSEVGVVTLKAERTVFTTELPGRTSAFLSADIRPQVGGIVQQRLFTEGATVKAGQALYQIDPSTYQAALSSAQAALARSKATAIAADATAGRNAELVKIDAVSKQVNDQSQAALAQAKADVATAQASVDTARINLAFTRLTSPITGRIGTSTVTPGALVTANQTIALTTVQQMDPLYVDVTQSSAEVLRLKRDFAAGRLTRSGADAARIKLLLEDGSPYGRDGKLQFAGISVNQTTGAVTLRATIPNPDGLLLPGMYVRAVVEEGADQDAVLAPQQGVVRDAVGRATALVIDKDDKVQRRAVTLGRAVGNRWLVRNGLAAGDRLVVEGSMRIKPGDTVKVVEVDPSAPAPARAPAAAPAAAGSADAAAGATAGAAAR
ncbi:efflux RND transporter periplasmic adaptor subunit [Xylophilus rhododendri]|uniref:Efflux RND transporter periplasmic adaptor subunit n=1 Tax=Xylophilus rhododendri TaxID=2697032 RepID=A0A857J5Y0_9BURK|nr:efflux RND transporter periplasmic adaptor subunit [Xylophilus rhododendri]QHI98245.1 efflux RND transporter periplasmic adaptor subunit [Xylophilus rhododendri]